MLLAPENMSHDQLVEANKKLQLVVSSMENKMKQMESQVSEMQFQIDQMKRLLYGAKRERFVKDIDENQLTFPFEVEEDKAPEKHTYKQVHQAKIYNRG